VCPDQQAAAAICKNKNKKLLTDVVYLILRGPEKVIPCTGCGGLTGMIRSRGQGAGYCSSSSVSKDGKLGERKTLMPTLPTGSHGRPVGVVE
jgi:hypothetical protein